MKKYLPLLLLLSLSFVFFWKFFFGGLLPIPADTIVGLYHPYRDLYAADFPNGIPFKNFLITDPVRQIYPWKELVIDQLSRFEFPTWNPYEMAGKPLLGNFQSSPFYPLNIILFFKPFYLGWSLFIVLQIFLTGIFAYLYLRNLKLEKSASALGSLAFSFSGFVISWLEWGNVIHTVLWLPLILLSIDKVFEHSKEILNIKFKIANIHIKNKKLLIWFVILLFSSVSSFLAGHLQIFFYVFVFSFAYLIFRWFEFGKRSNVLILFTIYYLLFTILTAIQWIPTLQFISLSARGIDQSFASPGWFIPWQNLIQFIFPDFFGNPTTLNYWGVWNWAEFVGYIGIIPLLFVIYALFLSKSNDKYFFLGAFAVAMIFSLPNPIAEIPFKLGIPLVSSSQPTRLIFIASFSLSILGAIGFDSFLKSKERNLKQLIPFGSLFLLFALVWIVNYKPINLFNISSENLMVANRNLIFPTLILTSGSLLILGRFFIKKEIVKKASIILLFIIVAFDLLRFSDKFTPFTKKEYLFPDTKIVEFIKRDEEIFRVASADSRIFAPNFLTHHRIATVEGYDPLYLQSYAELIASSERAEPNISPPFGFNRIITPHNLDSKIIDLLNVKYVFSLSEIDNEKFEKVFEEGQTKVYKNKKVLPRAFFVVEVKFAKDKKDSINMMFEKSFDPKKTAILSEKLPMEEFGLGTVRTNKYSDNEIIIESSNSKEGFLVLTDSFYPTWRAKINGEEIKIYRTDFNFRGIYVPAGRNTIVFQNSLF